MRTRQVSHVEDPGCERERGDSRGKVVMQSKLEPGQSSEDPNHDPSNDVPTQGAPSTDKCNMFRITRTPETRESVCVCARAPFEIEEEPSSPPDNSELIHDGEEEERGEADDGNESARFLLDVLGRQPVDRDPRERHLFWCRFFTPWKHW